ncbi:hypothetical protein B0H10DRAFT_2187542, partial [Mycena sp. CBHHK59/15]
MSTVPATTNTISSGVTFVINTQGLGPFFNINLAGASTVEHLTFNVDPASNGSDAVQNATLIARSTTAHPESRSGANVSSASITTTPLAHPQQQFLQSHKVADNASQEVEVPEMPQSPLADCSDTEDEDELIDQRHAAEPVAIFSRCTFRYYVYSISLIYCVLQLVTPSRKRKLDLMKLE